MTYFLQLLANGLVIGTGYGLVALGLSLVYGSLKVLNFAHGQFYMVAGIMTWWLGSMLGWDYWVSGIAALVVVLLLGLIVEFLVIRPLSRRDEFRMLVGTLALNTIIANVALLIFGGEYHRIDSPLLTSVTVGGVRLVLQDIFVILVMIVILVGLHFFLRRTRWGLFLRASGDNPRAARYVGVPIRRAGRIGFVIAALLAGVAGVVSLPSQSVSVFSGDAVLFKAFIVIVVGGLGSLYGAAIFGLVLGVAEAIARGYAPAEMTGYVQLIGYLAVVVVLLLRPQGLFGRLERTG
jgi:branched-chain amino acid transport system permease protein